MSHLKQQLAMVFETGTDVPAASPEALAALFEAWLGARAQRAEPLSPASARVYRAMWGAWSAFLVAQRQTLDSFDAGSLERYLVQRLVSDRHARRLIVLVDWLCGFDAQREEKSKNTGAQTLLQEPRFNHAERKTHIPLPRALSDAQAQALLSVVMTPVTEGDWMHLRNNAMVAVMLGAGIKPGETLALKLGAIGVEPSRAGEALPYKLSIVGKTGPRQTPLAPYARRILASWLIHRALLKFPGEVVFPATLCGGGVLNDSAFYRHFVVLLEQANIFSEKKGAHALRHTFATRNLRGGKPLPVVADWLGLETMEAAYRYRRLVTGETSVV